MTDKIYYLAEIYFTYTDNTGLFGSKREKIKYFSHLVLATDKREAQAKADKYAHDFFKDSESELKAVMVHDTII